MQVTRALTVALALALTAGTSVRAARAPLPPATVEGSWAVSFADGRALALDLKVDGEKVTGRFAGSSIEGEFKDRTLTCADPVNWAAWRSGTIGGDDAPVMYPTVVSATLKDNGTLSGWTDVFIRGYGPQPIKRMGWTAARLPQQRPDLSGTWVVTSAPHAPQRLRVTQEASRVSIVEYSGARERTLVFQLNGTDSRNETRTLAGEIWSHVSQAKWVSNALVVTTTTTRGSTGRSWAWMTTYFRDGDGNLKVTTLDLVTDPEPFMSMAQSTVVYAKAGG